MFLRVKTLILLSVLVLIASACGPAATSTDPNAAAPTETTENFEAQAGPTATPTTAPTDTPSPTNTPTPTETPPPPNRQAQADQNLAPIESVSAVMMESFPVQVAAIVSGVLSDGCTEIDTIRTELRDNTFFINIETVRPADKVCTAVLQPFEERVSLDVLGLPAGNYTINANGATTTFNLATDNIMPNDETETLKPSLLPEPCVARTADEASLMSRDGYCLLHPSTLTVATPAPGVTTLLDLPEEVPSAGSFIGLGLNVTRQEAPPNQNLNGLVASQMAEFSTQANVNVTTETVTLGGEPGIVLQNVPGMMAMWQVFAQHDDWLYTLSFFPADDPALTPEFELLYDQVMASFTFMDRPTAKPSDSVGNGRWKPTPAETCQSLNQRLSETLGVAEVDLAEAPFQDYVNGGEGQGCQSFISGTGAEVNRYEDYAALREAVSGIFREASWQAVPDYAADGPTNTAQAYRQGDDLCLLSLGWVPTTAADCPADQPITACNVPPEAQRYTISLTCAQSASADR